MKPKIAFPFRHHAALVCEEAKQMLVDAGFELVCNDTGEKLSKQAQMDMIKDAYGIVTGTEKYDAEMINAAENCRVIIRFGVGLDNFDLDAMRTKGIQVGVVENNNAVAEFALTIILSVLKNLPRYDTVVRQGQWQRFSMRELRKKSVGVVGFGRIGVRLVELLQGFDVRILVYDPYVSQEKVEKFGAEKMDLDDLLTQSDVVSLHLPVTPETKYLINAKTLAKMKTGAYLINTSRGELVDEPALLEALRSGKLAGVGMDVFETEPVTKDNPLLSIENTVLTPHVAALTYETNYKAGIISAESIIAVHNGGRPLHPVY